MDIKIIIWLLFSHWVADFILQSDWMAQNKSKRWDALLAHCSVYGIALGILTLNPIFGLINAFIHILVDFFTSRLNSYLWDKKEVHWFFVSIGFDQFIHFVTLILTYNFLVK